MRGTFAIARIVGIPIRINPSWFLSLFLVVSILSLQVFPDLFPDRERALYWSLGLAGGMVFFASIVLHELGHSLVARHYGIPVASITLFVFGGVSQITREASGPRAESLMAAAGPAVSLALGGMFLGLRFLLLPDNTPAGLLVEWLGVMNLVLGIFNLLPGFPMDGGRLFRSALWGISGNYRIATRIASWLSRALAVLLIIGGVAELLNLSWWPLSGDPIGGAWLVIIGLFLNSAAGQTQAQSRVLEVLKRYRADQVMDADVPVLPAETTLRSLFYDMPLDQHRPACFVYHDGRLVGLLPRERLYGVPAERWASVTVADLMIRADLIRPALPATDGATLLQRMDSEALSALPIVNAGTVEGLVTRSALLELLRRRPELIQST
ncbi:MAG: site-2 protease family protein [Dehalococcoidia bacterium]